MHTVYLGLGTNLGNREENLKNALSLIEDRLGKISKTSSILETPAWGVTDVPDYLNMVIEIKTNRWPLELIEAILAIEEELGRVRTQKWGSRIIDIDILFFNDWHFSTPGLTIPHPYLTQRDFVKLPLKEIAPELIHPVILQQVSEL